MSFILYESIDSGGEWVATLLSESINILYEPSKRNKKIGVLIKYPSGKAHEVSKKKLKTICLRRTLDTHLLNIVSNVKHMKYGIDFLEKRVENNIHPMLINLKKSIDNMMINDNKDPLLYHSFYWLNDVYWMEKNIKKDLLIINTEDFFNNPKKQLKHICNFLDIKYVHIKENFNINFEELVKNNKYLKVNKLGKKINNIDLSHLNNIEDKKDLFFIVDDIVKLFYNLLKQNNLI